MGSDATWMSFLTGVRPGRHGRYFYRQPESGSYSAYPLDEKSWGRVPFWIHLGRSGRRCVSIDMPYGAIVGEFDGIQVTDWLIHDRIYPQVRTWPEDLADRLVEMGGRHEAHVHDLHGRTRAHYKDLVDKLKERVDIKAKVALDFAAQETWDIFLLGFSDAHDAGHICWHLHDPSHPRHDAALVAEIGDPVKAIYMAIDAALGRLLDAMDENVTVGCSMPWTRTSRFWYFPVSAWARTTAATSCWTNSSDCANSAPYRRSARSTGSDGPIAAWRQHRSETFSWASRRKPTSA
jgi:predicted AlkP superfamily phosphohydrolase/phosphomutase